jgi:hypothetical protein
MTDYIGRKKDGTRTQYGFGNTLNKHECLIEFENVIIRSNNPYRIWVKLWEYCKSKDTTREPFRSIRTTTEIYLLPLFDDNIYNIYQHTTPVDLVNTVLERYKQLLEENIYWIKLEEL